MHLLLNSDSAGTGMSSHLQIHRLGARVGTASTQQKGHEYGYPSSGQVGRVIVLL